MRRVILESPFAGTSVLFGWFQRWRNVRYARRCVRDSLLRGEAPIASHLLYTQRGILRDHIAKERKHGIDAGLAWREAAQASVVYTDRGVSPGMLLGINAARKAGRAVEYRSLIPGRAPYRPSIEEHHPREALIGHLAHGKTRREQGGAPV